MSELNRRDFVRAAGAAVPIARASREHGRHGDLPLPSRPLDAALLRAMAEVILPSELGQGGIAHAVSEFQRWLREYAPGAEVLHGYGSGEIRHLPEDPGPRWNEQLTELNRRAERQFGREYAALDIADRRTLVRGVLADDDAGRLPPAVNARHVAVGLLAHFYASPEAHNLCHRAEINPYACRPLVDAPAKPADRSRGRSDA